MSLIKKCKKCNLEKSINEFYTQKSRGKEYKNNVCIECIKKNQKEYRQHNKDIKKKLDKEYYEKVKNTNDFIEKSKKYRNSRKKEKIEYDKKYRATHKKEYIEYCKLNKELIAKVRHQYYLNHKEERKKYNKNWEKYNRKLRLKINIAYILRRYKRDALFRLRSNMSKTIARHLNKNFKSKNGGSIFNFLPYTIKELKMHLQSQFQFWMSWDNYGSYRVDIWDDNNPSTWTWNIDHIVPHSKFKYFSMEDEEFKKCWALDNLRPYSAKQNLLDSNKTR